MTSEINWQNRDTTKDGPKLINPNNRSLDFDNINEYAKKFRLPGERNAFLEGVRLGFNWASERYVEYLSEFEKRRTNNIIVIKDSQQPPPLKDGVPLQRFIWILWYLNCQRNSKRKGFRK